MQGDRLKEGSLINVSLMNLGRCLEVCLQPKAAAWRFLSKSSDGAFQRFLIGLIKFLVSDTSRKFALL